MSLYEDLGVEKGAPPSVIKAAYRKLAGQHHPDREGGDVEKFKVIQNAYDILGDEVRRTHYDETGEVEEEDSVRKQALHNLASLLLSLVDSIDVTSQSVKEAMLATVRSNMDSINNSIMVAKKRIALRKRVIERFTHKIGEDDYVRGILEGSIRAENQAILLAQNALQICDDMLLIIHGYDYAVDTKTATTQATRRIYLSNTDFTPM